MSSLLDSNKTSVLEEILHWSRDRPDWQRDALRRIIVDKITQQDIDELEKLCCMKHNALEASEHTAITLEPLEAKHIPASLANNSSISIISLGQLQHVNRLPSNQTLPFGEAQNLVIIYGDNGTGKSGYARVIKKACRARGLIEAIQPDAYTNNSVGSAAATFIIKEDNVIQPPINWQDGGKADARLEKIFLFDAACAEHYINENSGTTFTPFGLDVLEKLANQVCLPISDKIRNNRLSKLNQIIIAAKQYWKHKPDTTVGKFVSTISEKTKESDIDTAANWTDGDNTRLLGLNTALASDPKIQASKTQAASERIRNFRKSIAIIRAKISVVKITAFRGALDEAQTARAIADMDGKFDGSFLPGTGNKIWQALWNAAREYSTQYAYSIKPFPPTDDEDRCVLCQSILDNDSKSRLKKFDTYISSTASKIAEQKEYFLGELTKSFASLPVLSEEMKNIEADLTTLEDVMLNSINNFIISADKRLKAINNVLNDGNWNQIPDLASLPNKILRQLEKKLLAQSKIEMAAANPAERKQMEKERDELEDRKWLAGVKDEVIVQIQRYSLVKKLEQCLKDTQTNAISIKNKELTKKFVTDTFCKRFEAEASELNLRSVKVKVHTAEGARGVTKFGVRLEGSNKAEVKKIASDGEKRCIALALFLSELSQLMHKSTLVFDDPVSSLDHSYRERIAIRLVKESQIRQVIVFTHDPVFLHDLCSAAAKSNMPAHLGNLQWLGDIPGQWNEGLPWKWKSPIDRFNILEKEQRAIAKKYSVIPSEDDEREIRRIYSNLRATLERLIEHDIFGDAVFRFRTYIDVKKVEKVIGFSQSEFDDLSRLHKRCCDATDAHDPAQGQHATLPTPQELAQDIIDTKSLYQKIHDRHKKIEQQKKAKTP
jgi:hypothetical protein